MLLPKCWQYVIETELGSHSVSLCRHPTLHLIEVVIVTGQGQSFIHQVSSFGCCVIHQWHVFSCQGLFDGRSLSLDVTTKLLFPFLESVRDQQLLTSLEATPAGNTLWLGTLADNAASRPVTRLEPWCKWCKRDCLREIGGSNWLQRIFVPLPSADIQNMNTRSATAAESGI